MFSDTSCFCCTREPQPSVLFLRFASSRIEKTNVLLNTTRSALLQFSPLHTSFLCLHHMHTLLTCFSFVYSHVYSFFTAPLSIWRFGCFGQVLLLPNSSTHQLVKGVIPFSWEFRWSGLVGNHLFLISFRFLLLLMFNFRCGTGQQSQLVDAGSHIGQITIQLVPFFFFPGNKEEEAILPVLLVDCCRRRNFVQLYIRKSEPSRKTEISGFVHLTHQIPLGRRLTTNRSPLQPTMCPLPATASCIGMFSSMLLHREQFEAALVSCIL